MLYKTDDVMNVHIDKDFSLRKTLADLLMKMNFLGSTHWESSAGCSTWDTDWTFWWGVASWEAMKWAIKLD